MSPKHVHTHTQNNNDRRDNDAPKWYENPQFLYVPPFEHCPTAYKPQITESVFVDPWEDFYQNNDINTSNNIVSHESHFHEIHLPLQNEQENHSHVESNQFTDCQNIPDNNFNYQNEKPHEDVYVEHKTSNDQFEQQPVVHLQEHSTTDHSQFSSSSIQQTENSIKSHSKSNSESHTQSHSIKQSQVHIESDAIANESISTEQNEIKRPDEGNQVGKFAINMFLCIWGSCDVRD